VLDHLAAQAMSLLVWTIFRSPPTPGSKPATSPVRLRTALLKRDQRPRDTRPLSALCEQRLSRRIIDALDGALSQADGTIRCVCCRWASRTRGANMAEVSARVQPSQSGWKESGRSINVDQPGQVRKDLTCELSARPHEAGARHKEVLVVILVSHNRACVWSFSQKWQRSAPRLPRDGPGNDRNSSVPSGRRSAGQTLLCSQPRRSRKCLNQTHDPSVAGSSPARPTDLPAVSQLQLWAVRRMWGE
jgi:hypothetical protein